MESVVKVESLKLHFCLFYVCVFFSFSLVWFLFFLVCFYCFLFLFCFSFFLFCLHVCFLVLFVWVNLVGAHVPTTSWGFQAGSLLYLILGLVSFFILIAFFVVYCFISFQWGRKPSILQKNFSPTTTSHVLLFWKVPAPDSPPILFL